MEDEEDMVNEEMREKAMFGFAGAAIVAFSGLYSLAVLVMEIVRLCLGK